MPRGDNVYPPHWPLRLVGSTTPEPLQVVFWDEIRPQLDAADFVEGLLIDRGMSVVYGQSNSGKTFWTSDLALHVAAGLTWNGREVERGGVLWLAMEGSHGIFNRISAWRDEHGMDVAELPFAVIPTTLNLLDPGADTERLVQAIHDIKARLGMAVRLTVVDTLSRAMAGGNENAPDDMGALVTNGARIQQEAGSHLSWIHHSGKDEAKGARGHSLLRAATDTEIEITAVGAQRVARVTKQRDLDCAGEFTFALKVVELGRNKRGKPVTSCVVEGSEGGHTNPTSRGVLTSGLSGHHRRALEVLADVLLEKGRPEFDGVPSGLLSVPAEWWRDRFYERTLSDEKRDTKQDSRKRAFYRSVLELQNRHLIGVNRGRVWLSRRDIDVDRTAQATGTNGDMDTGT